MTARTPRNECWSCQHKRDLTGNCHISCAKPDHDMTGDSHGINSGWFCYPYDYDPIWKTTLCTNYKLTRLTQTKENNNAN